MKKYSPFLAYNKSVILNLVLLLQFCTFVARKYTQQRVKRNIFHVRLCWNSSAYELNVDLLKTLVNTSAADRSIVIS